MTSFNKAFASARKAGKKTFSWNGKSYTTKLASEGTKRSTVRTPKTGPVPKSRPSTAAPKARPKADYPRPAKDVGIAKANSWLGKAAAAQENKAVKPPPSRANNNQNTVKKNTPTPRRRVTGGGGGW